jgi:hypothetical protein
VTFPILYPDVVGFFLSAGWWELGGGGWGNKDCPDNQEDSREGQILH